jgi:hypothetical protein
VDANGDNQLVAQADGLPDHVEMAIGDGIEGAGIKRNAGHGPVYPAAPGPASRRVPGNSVKNAVFI